MKIDLKYLTGLVVLAFSAPVLANPAAMKTGEPATPSVSVPNKPMVTARATKKAKRYGTARKNASRLKVSNPMVETFPGKMAPSADRDFHDVKDIPVLIDPSDEPPVVEPVISAGIEYRAAGMSGEEIRIWIEEGRG